VAQHLTAAGGCVVIYRAVEYQVDRIESCSTVDGLAAFGFPRSLVLRLLRRREFHHLHVAEADVCGRTLWAVIILRRLVPRQPRARGGTLGRPAMPCFS
jgi:hypothetical protein